MISLLRILLGAQVVVTQTLNTTDTPSAAFNSYIPQECLMSGMVALPGTKPEVYFPINGVNQCWLYCKFLNSCQSLFYDSITGVCELHETQYAQQGSYDKQTVVHVMKTCVQFVASLSSDSLSLEEIEELRNSGRGVVIQQHGQCLGFKKPEKSSELEQETNLSKRKLLWTSCQLSRSWIFMPIANGNDSTAGTLYQIRSNNYLGLSNVCFDLNLDHSGSLEMVLNVCKKATNTTNSTQIFEIIVEPSYYDKQTLLYALVPSIPKFNDRTIKVGDGQLSSLMFQDSKTFEDTPCLPENLFSPSSKVVNDEKLPFFLPGASITIQCNEGYVVKGVGFRTTQLMTCSREVEVKPCILMEQRKRNWIKKETSLIKMGLVIVVSLLLAVIFSVVVYGKTSQRFKKKGKIDSATISSAIHKIDLPNA